MITTHACTAANTTGAAPVALCFVSSSWVSLQGPASYWWAHEPPRELVAEHRGAAGNCRDWPAASGVPRHPGAARRQPPPRGCVLHHCLLPRQRCARACPLTLYRRPSMRVCRGTWSGCGCSAWACGTTPSTASWPPTRARRATASTWSSSVAGPALALPYVPPPHVAPPSHAPSLRSRMRPFPRSSQSPSLPRASLPAVSALGSRTRFLSTPQLRLRACSRQGLCSSTMRSSRLAVSPAVPRGELSCTRVAPLRQGL